MSLKIYDFLGNLLHKIRIDLDEIDLEGVSVPEMIKEPIILEQFNSGFKYYAAKSRVWVQVGPKTNLENVFVLKDDFEQAKHLKIVLSKNLNMRLEGSEAMRFLLDRKTMTVEHLLLKLQQYEKMKVEMKNLKVGLRSARSKQFIGMSLPSVFYYKSTVRKARELHFDFQGNFHKSVKEMVDFVKLNKK